MKNLFIIAVTLCVLGLVGFVGYVIIFDQDRDVSSSEIDGLEEIRPQNMRISEVGSDYFVVEWKTENDVSGYVKYGETSTAISLIAQDIDGTAPTRNHVVRVSNLLPGSKYYFWVMSDDVAFGKDGRALEVLTTLD